MNETLKKVLLFGIGSVYYTKDKVEAFMKELEKENVTPDEGKKLVEEFLQKADKVRKEQEAEIKRVVKETLDELGVATKKKDEEASK